MRVYKSGGQSTIFCEWMGYDPLRLVLKTMRLQIGTFIISNFHYSPKLVDNMLESVISLRKLRVNRTDIIELNSTAFEKSSPQLGLTSLEIVDSEQLTKIRNNAFADISSLRYLYLRRNRLSDIASESFEGLPHLITLDLSQNAITDVASWISSVPSSVQNLWMCYNGITTLRANTLESLSGLFTLYMDYNNIHTIEKGALDDLQNLTVLFLGENNLTSLETGTFAKTNKLKIISLVYNKFEHIKSGVFDDPGLEELESLDLSNNQIKMLDENSIISRSEYQAITLDLRNNPLNCSCELAWLVNTTWGWGTSLGTCAEPPHFKEESLDELNAEDLCNPPPTENPTTEEETTSYTEETTEPVPQTTTDSGRRLEPELILLIAVACVSLIQAYIT